MAPVARTSGKPAGASAPVANSAFAAKLAKSKAAWKAAGTREAAGFGGAAVEDGIYNMHVVDAELTESMSSGRLQIHWTFAIAEGESQGEQIHDYDGLASEENFFWVQQKLQRLGYDVPEDPAQLPALLKQIEKDRPLFRGRVKTKEDFTHVYINKRIEGEGGATPEPEAAPAAAEPEAAEPEPAATEEVTLEQGLRVSFPNKGATMEGVILDFADNDTKAIVEMDDGKKLKVKVEALTPVAGEAEPEDAEPVEEVEEAEPEPAKPAPKGRVAAVKPPAGGKKK